MRLALALATNTLPGISSGGGGAPSGGIPINALNRFEFGADGDAVTAAAVESGELGDGWTVTLPLRDPAGHTRIETTGAVSYAADIVAVEGTPVTTAGTRALKFDHAEAVTDGLTPLWDEITFTPPENITNIVLSGFIQIRTTAGATHTHDHIKVNGSPYLVFQHQLGQGGGNAGRVHIETQTGGAVTQRGNSIAVDQGTYHYEMGWNGKTGEMYMILRSEDLATVEGTSYFLSTDATDSPLTNVVLQDYLEPVDTYTLHDEFGRTWKDGDVTAPLFDLTVEQPSAITADQIGVGVVQFDWTQTVLPFTYKVELHDGTSWTTLFENKMAIDLGYVTVGRLRFTKTGLTDGLTYKLRLTGKAGTESSTAVESATVTLDDANAPVAVDDFDSYVNGANLDAQAGWEAVNGNPVVSVTAGAGIVYGISQAMACSAETFSADHRSECTCLALTPGSFGFVNVGVRCQSGADTRYWFQTDGTNWFLVKRNAGAQGVIANSTHSITSGAKIALNATGVGAATRLTAQVNTGSGWTNVTGATNIDPGGTYIDDGAPGIGGDGGSPILAHGDNWKGFDL